MRQTPAKHGDVDAWKGLPASALLGTRTVPPGEEGARFEDRAWLLVHYLFNKRPEEFARLQTELIHLRPPAEAWADALSDFPPSELDAVLDDYRRFGRYETARLVDGGRVIRRRTHAANGAGAGPGAVA